MNPRVVHPSRLHPALLSIALLMGVIPAHSLRADEFNRHGKASFYRADHEGVTASGETYDPRLQTGAHANLPFGSLVRVTHLGTGRSTVVRINDRSPFSNGHIIDVSLAAAQELKIDREGVSDVSVTLVRLPEGPGMVVAAREPNPAPAKTPQLRPVAPPQRLIPVSGRNPDGTLPIPALPEIIPPAHSVPPQMPEDERPPLVAPEDGQAMNSPVLRIQFGAFRDYANAKLAWEELQRMKIDARILESKTVGRLPFRVITSGVFFEEENANRWLTYFKSQTGTKYADAYVTR